MTSFSAVASAPGKAILFGEHAVVHGVTAIAAALSDLRIFADIIVKPGKSDLIIKFADIIPEGETESKPITISFDKVQSALPFNSEPLTAIHPSKEQQHALPIEFEEDQTIATQGVVTVVYVVANILSDVVWNKMPDETTYDIEVKIKSHGLPIGAGLGSSASFSVAIAGACIKLLRSIRSSITGQQQEDSDLIPSVGWLLPDSDTLPLINAWAYAAEILNHGAPSGLDNATSCYGGLVKFRKNADGQSFF
jgi:mevalonate kinase